MTSEEYDIVKSLDFIAYRSIKNRCDAEDIMQEVFISLLTNYKKFSSLSPADKRRYACVIIKNKCIDFNRTKTSRGKPLKHFPVFDSAGKVYPNVYSKIALKEVLQKGDGSKKLCRVLFAMAEGYTAREISQAKKVSINTVLGQSRYARKFLNT